MSAKRNGPLPRPLEAAFSNFNPTPSRQCQASWKVGPSFKAMVAAEDVAFFLEGGNLVLTSLKSQPTLWKLSQGLSHVTSCASPLKR